MSELITYRYGTAGTPGDVRPLHPRACPAREAGWPLSRCTCHLRLAVPCDYCGEPYHGRCTACHRPGIPYEYHSQKFSGLCAYKGERLCPACRDDRMAHEGADILVADDRPGMPDFVYNTVRDRDTVFIRVPQELRGIDGRDAFRSRSRNRRRS